MQKEFNKKIKSVRMNLQNGEVNIILQALELYKYNLKYMVNTENCGNEEKQEKYSLVDNTIRQVKQIQAEQINGKSESIDTTEDTENETPEMQLLKGIIPIDKKIKIG